MFGYEEFLEDYKKWDSLLAEFAPSNDTKNTSNAEEAQRANSSAKNILLTGATGFLGCFLLAELLRSSSHLVWCLVRCEDANSGLAKLRKSLEYYGIFEENAFSRVKVPISALFCFEFILLESNLISGMSPSEYRISNIDYRIANIDYRL
jgi:hypothetical protein